MDPLSITTSVITLVDATTKVYRFLQSIRHADSGYSALCMELHSLAGLLQSISRTFDDCRRHTFALAAIDEAVWDQSRLAIADCQQTIDDLTALVGRIGGLARNRSILRRTRIATQMHLHSGEAASFRDKVHVSTLSLQTLLQIINVSLSLRSNNSHDTTLRELRRLKRDLETSDRVARDIDCYSIDRFDQRLLRNLESLLSAARDFHSSASSKAGTIYGGGVARHNTEPEVDHTSTDSVTVPMVTPEKQRQMEVFVQHQEYLSRSKSPVPSNAISETLSTTGDSGDTHLVADGDSAITFDIDFNHLVSVGMGKLAQKAIREFDFAKAEDVLKHALARYKMTGPEDDRHSRLRTQHALCGLLLGKQSALEESVLDLAEYRGTKRTVADQLLFALALSYMHTLNFPKAQHICKLVGSNSSRSTRSAYPGKLDILKLFHVSYRLSGEDLLADAIEEQHPELSLQESLPTAGTFVAGCPELLGELFGTLNEPQMPSLVRGFWDFCGTTQETPLELRLAGYETDSVTNSALGSDLHISSGNTTATERDKSIGDGLGRQSSERLVHLKRLIRRVSLTRGAAPVTLPAKKVRNARAKTFYNGMNHNHAPGKAPIKEDTLNEPAFHYLQRTGATRRRVLSLLRGWATSPVPRNSSRSETTEAPAPKQMRKQRSLSQIQSLMITTTTTDSHLDEDAGLRRRFSFEGMPSTPTFRRLSMAIDTACQVSGASLAELMDTAIYELPDSGPTFAQTETSTESNAHRNLHRIDTTYAASVKCCEELSSSALPLDYSPLDSLMDDRKPQLLAMNPPEHSTVVNTETRDRLHESYSGWSTAVLTRYRRKLPPCPKPVHSTDEDSTSGTSQDDDMLSRLSLFTSSTTSIGKPTVAEGDIIYQGIDSDSGYESGDTARDGDLMTRPVGNDRSADNTGSRKKHPRESGNTAKHKTIALITALREAFYRAPRIRRGLKHSGSNGLDAGEDAPQPQNVIAEYRLSQQATSRPLSCGPFRSGRSHRDGLAYEYNGPDAVDGPFTLQDNEPPPVLQCAVPVRPENPSDMAAPVELDSREVGPRETPGN